MYRRQLNPLIHPVLWVVLVVFGCGFALQSHSQDNPGEQPGRIELPAQPLSQSLTSVARQLQIAIAFNPTQLSTITAPALAGNYTPAALLDELLEHSPFYARQQGSGWLILPRPPLLSPPSSEPEQVEVEDLLILGSYRRSQEAAIQLKQHSNAQIETVIADDIAQFPAHNIAEALQRSPGISVVRERGEALFLSIRGLPTRFNTLRLNGHNLAVNENVRNSEQYGRRFHYDLFPAELVAGVEVLKSAAADQDEGAIGGSVNLRTFAPLDLGPQLSFSAKANSAELAGDWSPRVAGLGSWVDDEQEFGALLAVAYSDRSLRQDRVLNFRWEQMDNPASNATNTLLTPSGLRPTLELEQRERLGWSAALQWQPASPFSIGLRWLQLRQTIDYQEFSYSADYQSPALIQSASETRGQALITGDTNNGSVQIGRESAGISDDNRLVDLNFVWEGIHWKWEGNWAESHATSSNPAPIKRTRLRRQGDVAFSFAYPGDQQLPHITYRTIDLTNPQDFPGRRLEWRVTHSEDSEDTLNLSLSRPVEFGWISGLKLGLQWRTHERNYWRKDRLITQGISGVYFPASYFEPMPVSDFLQTAHGLPKQWLVPDENAFWSEVDEAALYRSPFSPTDLLNSYRLSDDHYATYFMLDLNQPGWRWPLRGDVGIRHIDTTQIARGYQPSGNSTNGEQPVHARFDQHYQAPLPAANIVLETKPDLLWRSTLARVMARPDYQDLAPRLSFNSGDLASASGGNPDLKPVTGWQLDTALEFYPADNGLIAAGIFFKKLDNFFQTRTSGKLINGQLYEFTQPDNGASARIAGLELTLQTRLPEPLANWGVETNYTRTWSRATYLSATGETQDRLADVANNSVNAGIYREGKYWDMRLHYSWRDKVLNQVASANLAAQNIDAFGSLDMHTALHIRPGLSFTAEATNLTNAAQWESVLGDEFAGYTRYGRSFWLGIQLQLL
ncbi:MAG: hypothetical protein B0W54_13815 [Cellvibrio sp. 79]|nr:MAG: hypothetical protein B0W54_13815 [Cellvibrio sp. 79]